MLCINFKPIEIDWFKNGGVVVAMKRKLTPKQRKFANEFIKINNAYQSAISAGYSKAYAKNAG